MFSSWFGYANHDQVSASRARTTRTVVKEQHVEVIGGGHVKWQPPVQPRLPVELSTMCAHLAGCAVMEEEDIEEAARSRLLLSLAGVCRAWYECIFSRIVLPDVSLNGTTQVQSLYWSLEKNLALKRLTAGKTKRLCVLQGGRRQQDDMTDRQRSSLYDFVSNMGDFESTIKPYVRGLLRDMTALAELHLQTTPEILRPSAVLRGKHDVRQNLQSLSFFLSIFGGTGAEDVFKGLTREPTHSGPWSRLTHLQISGPAGFRLSMATSSSIGSLPSLTHLSLVMPNIVRDASMHGAMNTTPPAALQLLVLLLADQLEELVVVGHTLSGYMGWYGNYEGWLSGLQLPFAARERRRVQDALRIRLVKASVEDDATAHPNGFSSWMVARTREGKQWDWDAASLADADAHHGVLWTVRDWDVPYAPCEEPEREAEEASQSPTPTSGQQSQNVYTVTQHTNTPSYTLGIDDLD